MDIDDERIPRWEGNGVLAYCPGCQGGLSRFVPSSSSSSGVGQTNTYIQDLAGHEAEYHLLLCLGCQRGAFAVRIYDRQYGTSSLADFYPVSLRREALPAEVPEHLRAEVSEAETVASVGAYRAASALLRSALEKTLKANGYKERDLAKSIDAAAEDGIITASRKRQVHADVRRLGNDVVHDEWRRIEPEEFELARRYVVWLLEDFYADRATVEAELVALKRIDPVSS